MDMLDEFRDEYESRFIDFLWEKFSDNPEILQEFAEKNLEKYEIMVQEIEDGE